jgi:lipopolysaccharide biosynthesis glycosyltransferase
MAADYQVTRQTEIKIPKGSRVVVGALDDNMVYPTLVWAHSLDRGASNPVHVLIGHLSGSLSTSHKAFLEKTLLSLNISHEFVELTSDPRFISQGHISPTTFAKFILADLVPGLNVWIDIDTVTTPGWDSLFEEIEKTPQDSLLVVAERGDRLAGDSGLHSKPSELAFNAGVLGWPARKRIPWSEALDDSSVVQTQEQYLFNKLYESHTAFISERFNTLSYRYHSLSDSEPPFVVHYAGAHKPWHLPRRYVRRCENYGTLWSLWFEAEKALLRDLKNLGTVELVVPLQKAALWSGKFDKTRDHRGREFLRLLSWLGPLGWVVVALLIPWKRLIPRGTHPLH